MTKRAMEEEIPGGKRPRVVYPHAFKFLAPPGLSTAILGHKGAEIQNLQSSTNTKMAISDRNETYHSSGSRLVVVKAFEAEALDSVTRAVVAKQRELEAEAGLDMTAEMRFIVVVPRLVAGAVIGKGGSTIKELRNVTGCRIRVEDEKFGSSVQEQFVSLQGQPESIVACAARISAMVQEFSTSEWFQDWLPLAQSRGEGRLARHPSSTHPGTLTAHVRRPDAGSSTVPRTYSSAPILRATNNQMSGTGAGLGVGLGVGATNVGPLPHETNTVLQTIHSLPAGILDAGPVTISASVPMELKGPLIGKGGLGTKNISQQSGAKVALIDGAENCCVVQLTGTVAAVTSGYLLLMKRYADVSQQQQAHADQSQQLAVAGQQYGLAQHAEQHAGYAQIQQQHAQRQPVLESMEDIESLKQQVAYWKTRMQTGSC